MTGKPIVAIMYDFDKTLCTKDMQNYRFIPSLGIEVGEFWDYTNYVQTTEKMDSVLAYMYAAVKISKEKNIPIKRSGLEENGKSIEFFPGVVEWFKRINEFGKANNVEIEHYVISSGMKEIIDGTIISGEFKNIFACEYLYDDEGNAVWPKTAVNYTNKTQFVYRINKGVLDVSNDTDLNRSMPDDSKRIPFENMIYIGDGLSDVPCMKMMKSYGGKAIAVYQQLDEKVKELLRKDRVDFIYPADYSENSGLDKTVKDIIVKMSISDKLNQEYTAQLKSIG
ncbi:MAG: haloacid dehalogenase-like hydrolase [Oscillospiraceae bacterium]|nr:haloacid dehalogenase-like hydrolase [Oscillospiraceae bacterium]